MTLRVRRRIALVGLLFLAPAFAQAASFEVGATVPDLSLGLLGDGERNLSDRDGPTVLVFFRGVW